MIMHAFATAAAAVLVAGAHAQESLTTETVATGFIRPAFVGQPRTPIDPDRLWVIEQRVFIPDAPIVPFQAVGRLRVFDARTGEVREEPVVERFVAQGSDQGMLGLAFHPGFPDDPRLYIAYTEFSSRTVIEEHTIAFDEDEPRSVPGLARTILIIEQPFSNNNMTQLAFGPNDGFLYIASGDGGNNDVLDLAQDRYNVFGKLLRIDVEGDAFPLDPDRNYAFAPGNPYNGAAGAEEIFVSGLQDPRFAFDAGPSGQGTGDLWISDTGIRTQEINRQPGDAAGVNYGWRCLEGTSTFNTSGCPGTFPFREPVFEYTTTSETPIVGCSVRGGAVYQGCELLGWTGAYVFAEYCTDQIAALRPRPDGSVEALNLTDELAPFGSRPTFVGADARGELYIAAETGEISRIVPSDPIDDCNDCIEPCAVADVACPVGTLDLADIDVFMVAFIRADPGADFAAPVGVVDLSDLDAFIASYLAGC